VTSPARTILDLAVDWRERIVGRFIRRADDDKNFDLRAMEDLLLLAGIARWRGSPDRGA
jgi:hypothetical protein